MRCADERSAPALWVQSGRFPTAKPRASQPAGLPPRDPSRARAQELAEYLRRMWGEPVRFQGGTLHNVQTTLQHCRGVVYFNNCFRRAHGGQMAGDHIDLWTGTQYYNQIIHVGAGGDAHASSPLFNRADAVWFFQLPG